MLRNIQFTVTSRAGFVLAGGKSSRMGPNLDKAFLDFNGQTLLARALAVMASVCDSVTIVGDPEKFAGQPPHPRPAVPDIYPGCGPLGGIHAALLHSSSELNLMLAVDMPFVTGELLTFLLTVAEASEAIVIVPRAGQRLQPLCAVYRRAFSLAAGQALAAGKYKIDAVFAALPIRVIEENELTAAGFSRRSFFNVNTPEDRRAAENGLYGNPPRNPPEESA